MGGLCWDPKEGVGGGVNPSPEVWEKKEQIYAGLSTTGAQRAGGIIGDRNRHETFSFETFCPGFGEVPGRPPGPSRVVKRRDSKLLGPIWPPPGRTRKSAGKVSFHVSSFRSEIGLDFIPRSSRSGFREISTPRIDP